MGWLLISASSLNFLILSYFWGEILQFQNSREIADEMGTCLKNPVKLFLCFFLFCSFYLALFCNAADTISQGQSITDGQTLISSGQIFVLGFFSPENSTSRYVGIWYNISVNSVVWVANRDNPVSDSNGAFKIGVDGNLMVVDGNGTSVWSSNATVLSTNTTAILMDTGNFILSSGDSVGDTSKAYWQSFNNPTDTYLPGMKVLVNHAKGENRLFNSWKSASDPSVGSYTMGIDPHGAPQIVVWEGSRRRWRGGQWNGLIFVGIPNMTANYLYGFKLSADDGNGNMYFTYTPNNDSHILMFRIGYDGFAEQLKWNEDENKWTMMQAQPANKCEFYNNCGNYGSCNEKETPVCSCIHGFVPKVPDQWNRGNWSDGCVRRNQLQCEGDSTMSVGEADGFLEVRGVKLPDFADSVSTQGPDGCHDMCLNNCSCKAYAYVAGIGCMIWSVELADIERFSEEGKTFHVRLAGSELGGSSSKVSKLVIIAIVVSGVVFIGVSILLLWIFRSKLKAFSKSRGKKNEILMYDVSRSREFSTGFSRQDDVVGEGKPGAGPELPMFNFQCVAAATDNFSNANKLGQGGFGPVYKGKLPGGEEIAVKRLSRKSGQGVEEFKNEIILIAKLQHRNLVRLLGCCIQGEEKILLYEYMPNKSLDCFLFDPAMQAQLDWGKRFAIIEGIARGLLYLHRDSRLRIIHRDLKASNVLLDEEMNPKISDFGMARIFGGNQNEEANTNRVVGTYGYMSPEYAMEGLFSVKSDVYSFGVLLLEIISGKRNTSFRLSENSNLIGHAWSLWNEGKIVDLIDPSIVDSCPRNIVLRCIHVGMLCVQDSAAYRPTMSSVVLMLESETAPLPVPKQPTFTSMRSSIDDNDAWNENQYTVSSNEITVSVVTGR